jgi:hypothetical protein
MGLRLCISEAWIERFSPTLRSGAVRYLSPLTISGATFGVVVAAEF